MKAIIYGFLYGLIAWYGLNYVSLENTIIGLAVTTGLIVGGLEEKIKTNAMAIQSRLN